LDSPHLTTAEFNTVGGWLVQGAKGPNAEEQTMLEAIPAKDLAKIEVWEEFFNRDDAKHKMMARYLYEHLFLTHLTFGTGENNFYELVRSKTLPGQAIKVIATNLPSDSPGEDPFYYRIRKIHSTIVHKTHMVFDMSDAQMDRFNELFIKPDWLIEPTVMGYEQRLSANPFKIYEQIPTRSRYQFLLDNNRCILMAFIRGPVCKEQVALNVIQDHFWALFLDPDFDLSVKHPGFLQTYSGFLEALVESHFKPEQNISFDVNYLREGEAYPPLPEEYETTADYLQGFKSVSRPGSSFFTHVLDHNANLAYVRIMVNHEPKDDVYISIVINRWHEDITTLFGEANKLRPEKDNATFVKGFVGSYPNYFYEVSLEKLPQFFAVLRDFDGSEKYWKILNNFGINRMNDRFWEVYDRFQDRFMSEEPLQAGLFDLNRYYYLALKKETN